MRFHHVIAALALGARMLGSAASSAAQSAAASPSAPQPSRADLARALRVLATAPVIDGHNDLPWRVREDSVHMRDVRAYDLRTHAPGMTDIPRLRQGRVGGQFWSIYIPGERGDALYAANGAVSSVPGYARVQLEQIDIAREIIDEQPAFAWALTAAELRASPRRGKIGSLLGLEGGHAIENSLAVLRQYYTLGARYMTLTHNVTLDWADAALDSAKHGGLTPFGREVVREMNRVGMLVDLAHVSPGTMSAALDVSEAPVIFSHSGARALVNHPRNVPDSILARVPKNGGVVMVPFVTAFVSPEVWADDQAAEAEVAAIRRRRGADTAGVAADYRAWRAAHPRPKASIAQVADHIEHVRKLAGVDHVGIGSDFDGITENVVGLEDVSKFPSLFAELARRGWSDADLAKLSSGNVLRVLAQAERVAARLQKTRGPSVATIQELDRGMKP
ncbi:MAG TPA: dipeptidase [Gemmatimonadaceae bacterium]|jgi:membrane dipeptidase|nr:dipeptidase [Gemmatimonadaceae bacterium]